MQNNRPKQNYFDMKIRQQGEDFLLTESAKSIQISARRRIFREMVNGEIDYSMYGKYFMNSSFLENLLIPAKEELNNNAVIRDALINYDLCFPGTIAGILKGKYVGLAHVYTVLVDKLECVKISGNIGFLVDISAVLANYRNLMNNV